MPGAYVSWEDGYPSTSPHYATVAFGQGKNKTEWRNAGHLSQPNGKTLCTTRCEGTSVPVPESITAKFESSQEGWSCGRVTRCGSYGTICGGYDVKAHSHSITKTFQVSPGTYSVKLDFIKIDSWFVS